MNDKKYTIQELAEEVNRQLKNSTTSDDARYSEVVSERRIRSYITKQMLDKPYGTRGEKWFGQSHVDKLVALRQLQSDGLSDKSILKMNETVSQPNDEAMQQNALSFLSNLRGSTAMPLNLAIGSSTQRVLSSYYAGQEDSGKSKAINMVKKQVNKTWNEYQLDDEGRVFLKIESNTKVKNGQEILSQIKSILNIEGDKND